MPAKKKTPARKPATKAKSAQTKQPAARKAVAKPSVKKVRAIPEGMTAITPHLICAGASDAIEFYKKAFNAVEEVRMPSPNGKLMHASVRIGGATVMLVDEMPEWGCLGPKALKGSPVTIHLLVEDADATVAQAVKAGATVLMPLADMFWGDRYGKIEDPFGHQWSIATHQRDVSPEEMQQAVLKMCDPAAAGN
jgi:PhnB protein